MSYIGGRFEANERRWIVLAALVLLPVFFLPVLPIWHMRLWAPQYREGLELVIYSNTIKGDLQNINTLNHYVGMHAITPQDFREFTYLPQALTAFGLLALLGALFNRRWFAILGWLTFTAFSAVMFGHYANWLYHYGHDLNPRAALKLTVFTPPLIGFKQMANFKVLSFPGLGTVLLGIAWALGPIVFWSERRAARRAARESAAHAEGGGTAAAVAIAFALAGIACSAATPAQARAAGAVVVPARPGALAMALAAAGDGDTLRLAAGIHAGPARVERRIVLSGAPGASIVGPGTGTVLTIAADGVTVEDVTLSGSGKRVLTIDSALQIVRAGGVTVRRVRVRDALYGIYAERATGLRIEDCDLVGRVPPMKEDGEGNGIHLWYCAGPRIVRNRVERFTDGVYLSFVDRAHVEGNRLHHCGRYGLHTMYCQKNDLIGNRFEENVAGCAIMFSNHLRVLRNDLWRNRGPRTYGLLLRDCSDGTFEDNRVVDNTVGVFMDNSNRNHLRGNLVQDNGWGMILFASCAENEVAGNAFLHNDYPVSLDMRRTTNRFDDGRHGNYWSENAPYDLDGDGRSDVPYSPVSAFSFLSKQYPDLAVLGTSPAASALSVAERVLPALRPSEAIDHFPRLAPVFARGTGVPLERPAPAGATWTARAGFGALLVLGAAGVFGAPEGGMNAMVRVDGLKKRYGDIVAVDDLSFDVECGETFALIGPNGAGKTTTLKILLGLTRPDAGRIAIGPHALAPDDVRARTDVGYVPQRVALPPGRSVRDVLGFFAALRDLPVSAVETALERVGLSALATRRASELSGGYTQRLSLAQALLGDPALLVLDEPTASLDPEATWEFRTLIEQLRREGKTILLCSHLLSEVERIADRVLILVGGRRAALERVADLRLRQVRATRMLVELTSSGARAAEALARHDLESTAVGDHAISVEGANGHGQAVLEALRAEHIDVRSFEVQRPTLEDVFLQVVRGGPRHD